MARIGTEPTRVLGNREKREKTRKKKKFDHGSLGVAVGHNRMPDARSGEELQPRISRMTRITEDTGQESSDRKSIHHGFHGWHG